MTTCDQGVARLVALALLGCGAEASGPGPGDTSRAAAGDVSGELAARVASPDVVGDADGPEASPAADGDASDLFLQDVGDTLATLDLAADLADPGADVPSTAEVSPIGPGDTLADPGAPDLADTPADPGAPDLADTPADPGGDGDAPADLGAEVSPAAGGDASAGDPGAIDTAAPPTVTTTAATVTFAASGLTWHRQPLAASGYTAAVAGCKASKLEGGGWRLPTVGELAALACPACAPVQLDAGLFSSIAPHVYWTATTATGGGGCGDCLNVHCFNFATGQPAWQTADGPTLPARCVRP